MDTKIVPITESLKSIESKGLQLQIKMRETELRHWLTDLQLSDRLSGTLKKNAKIGMKCHAQLTQEALCQTLGWCFETVPSSYVTFNDAITEGDCHALTEAGRHIDRLMHTHVFDEDLFETKYINIQDQYGNIEKQGIGVVVKQTSVQRIGNGKIVFALLAEFDPKTKERTECQNPF